MALTLRIENEIKLPDGGPVSITVSARRNIDIGRDTHLDWTLPDPTRHVSSKHCEVQYREGGYWLHDVSTNGTFLNGSDHRMQAPHRLRNGDRFVIGPYIIAASVEGEGAVAPGQFIQSPAPNYQELWANDGGVPPPIDRAALKPPKERNTSPDFLDWAADVPDAAPSDNPFGGPPFAQQPPPAPAVPSLHQAAPSPVDSWATGKRAAPPPAPEPPPLPTPRRPSWVASEPDSSWSGEPEPAALDARVGPAPDKPAAPHAHVEPAPDRPAAPDARVEPAPDRPAAPVARVEPAPDRPAAPVAHVEPAPDRPAAPRRQAVDRPAEGTATSDFLQRIAHGARVPPEYFAQHDPAELAELMGQLVRLVIEGTMQLLNARQQAKRLARSSSHTVIEAFDNNPLKFSATAEDALRILFGPATRSYLDVYSALSQSFDDLKSHQVKTYAAVQHALMTLTQDLDPEAIQRESSDQGLAALVGSRKARLWDAYLTRWQAKAGRDGGGLIDAFMRDFAKSYDRIGDEP